MPVTEKSREFWDREVQARTYVEWMGIPRVRSRINKMVSGDEAAWPLDWFQRTYPDARISRALSIGCGAGALERDLIRRGICTSIVAFDASLTSLTLARKAAKAEGIEDKISYYAADFNEPFLPPGRFDAVFIHQALHHVAKLEKLLRAISITLRPDGILYLEELLGPSRTQWDAERLGPLARAYDAIPRAVRQFDSLPLPIQGDDPSEAIRSGEIREQLAIGFEIEHERGYGGNVLAVLVPSLVPGMQDEALIDHLIYLEDVNLAKGEASFYAVVSARPKPGMRGVVGRFRYFFEPKLKRVAREVLARVAPR